MKSIIRNVIACTACLLFASTSSADIIYETDYSDPAFVDGPLAGQDGWAGQTITTVDTATDSVSQTGGSFGRNVHTSTATGGAGFNVGDVMTITFDYQYTMDADNANRNLAFMGFGQEVTNAAPSSFVGFGLRHREFDTDPSTQNDGSFQFSPNSSFNSGEGTVVQGIDVGINYGDPNDAGDDDFTSDKLRVTWSISNAGSGSWNVDTFQVENLDTSTVFAYGGSVTTITFNENDAQLFQQLNRGGNTTGSSDGVRFEYFSAVAVPEPSAAVFLGLASLGFIGLRRKK